MSLPSLLAVSVLAPIVLSMILAIAMHDKRRDGSTSQHLIFLGASYGGMILVALVSILALEFPGTIEQDWIALGLCVSLALGLKGLFLILLLQIFGPAKIRWCPEADVVLWAWRRFTLQQDDPTHEERKA